MIGLTHLPVSQDRQRKSQWRAALGLRLVHGEAWLVSVGVLWKRWSGAVASNASNFVGVAGMQLRCNCWLPESSSSSSSTIYKERNACLTRIQISQQLSRSEENLMSQSLCHLAVNIPGAHSEQSLWSWKQRQQRLDIPTTLLQRFRPACASSLCWDWHPTEQGSSFGFC